MSSSATDSLNLIFDADDTLWDSNIHFLEAFDSFAAAVSDAGLGLSRIEIHAAVRRAEIRLIKTLGYGRRPYLTALHQAAAELAPAGLLSRKVTGEVKIRCAQDPLKKSSNRDEVPHLFLITGCRAQPPRRCRCRRKRETHRGFHIQ